MVVHGMVVGLHKFLLDLLRFIVHTLAIDLHM